MADSVTDPKPYDWRPDHWNYGRCGWQVHFDWDDRVPMSELGLGPNDVNQNIERRVSYVSLRGRHLDDDVFKHLASFKYLNTLNVVETNLNDDFVPLLLKLHALRWLWVGGTDLTYDAAMHLERSVSGLMVFQRGEGAIQDKPGGQWVKIGTGVWPKSKRKAWWATRSRGSGGFEMDTLLAAARSTRSLSACWPLS